MKKKVLVVEDNELNRMMLAGILESEYEVLQAENGERALEILRENSEQISLVLLDIVMPVMDGYTFLSRMKEEPEIASIPVIVTTQKDRESDEVAALAHGATDFVAKPYRPQIILYRAASIIKLRETASLVNLLQYDRLTGLYSKEYFYRKVQEQLVRDTSVKYDIICSDIENFKLVNDVFGIAAGDRLLQNVASVVREVAGELGICGRLNADQFVWLARHQDEWDRKMFESLNSRINSLSEAGDIVIKWGVYSIEDYGLSIDQMCDRVVIATNSIKGRYGRIFAYYDDKLRSRMLREQEITGSMEAALATYQFEVYFQPKYRIADDSLIGAEALVRWNHPDWGLQSPGEFIPVFEKNGFIARLDQFVWDQTSSALRSWREEGYRPIPVSVNVSRADIYNTNLIDILQDIVRKHGISPEQLHLEITESAYTENPDQIIGTVKQLRELGFIIEMDDFGSGYSSLNMLNQLPMDILKLDMRFIQGKGEKPFSKGILKFIMDLARWMKLQVVAEGVETKEQLDDLREIGCDYAQGYYYSRPIPRREFEKLLANSKAVQENEYE